MEDKEKEDEVNRAKSRSPSPGIKSTAVVKYTAFQSPVEYARLQCNTDLNMPPSNWGAAIDSYGLKQILTRGTGLSSFRMAHMFPDCVGEVDVISGAECIKKLLKLPYQPNATVSMMVHRVENTLLLDDFDVYDYLMKSEWSWLKDFFYENVLKTMTEQELTKLMISPGPSSALQLTHKFLSHSVTKPQLAECPKPQPDNHTPMSIAGPFLPEPDTKTKPEEPPTEHLYNRNVLWTFEDIHMLIGSDLPIFGDKDRPCVSLRLRDAREPINVLTGIDYWLDNLMCNVPEVLMCYHLDGIVQKYEPMKTEDLPNMEKSKFSPKVIRNVAQNILSFLKSNATKSGHTYWLFKGPHDDVVKLYDLTSLCPGSMDNPFTTPVAMLLYRVARNMRMTNRSKHVKQLLEHVIELLKVERYPHIVASSHYMLADLYVPATTNPANPDFKDESIESEGVDADCSEFPPHTDDISEETVDITETQPEKSTEMQSEKSTEMQSEKSTEMQSEKSTEMQSEKSTEMQSEKSTEMQSEKSTKMQSEKSTEMQSKKSTEMQSEKSTEMQSEKSTEMQLEKSIEMQSEKSTEMQSEKSTEMQSEKSTEMQLEKSIEMQSEKSTEMQSEKSTEKVDTVIDDAKALLVQIRGLALKEIGDRIKVNTGGQQPHSVSSQIPSTAPDRCGKALQHALKGLLALHNVTMHKSKVEERERLKQQILIEEQHPKMANPYEPIKMTYEPITKNKADKEHTSRGRRRKRERKASNKSGNFLIESQSSVDKNAIQIVKDKKKVYSTWHEPNRDDNFAWKLHLKTLLYEKICLAYATLAEYSYSDEQYGFSLKYIELASKCQKLLCNMIIKSKVVDVGCLLGRVGDNYFQISRNWENIERYKKQFETDHDVDRKIRLEIENDMVEEVDDITADEFDLNVSIPSSDLSAMLRSCEEYRRAAGAEQRPELLRRFASVSNELAVRHMNDAQDIFLKLLEEKDRSSTKAKLLFEEYRVTSCKSVQCLEEATEIFKQVNDIPNLALLLSNKGRYLRFKAHCNLQVGFNSEKRKLYADAEELYQSALKLLGPRETTGATSVWELVAWELSSHLYTKAVLMQESPELYSHEPNEVAEALKYALKHCVLSPGPKQYLYQFRASMIYHRLASLYHSQYRITREDGPKRRTLFNMTKKYYEQAAHMFAILEDLCMFLTVQMEHVALLETQAAVTPNLKLKSLQTAVQLLRQCHSVMELLKDKDPEDQKDVTPQDSFETIMHNEHGLLNLFENRLNYILKSIIQYCRSKSNKDYDKITDFYKKLYSASLKIKKDDDIRVYAGSICKVMESMEDIDKEFD